MTLEDRRRFYAEEVAFVANVHSDALVSAFANVPREKYLGPGPWHLAIPEAGMGVSGYREFDDVEHLYHNVLVAIDVERNLNNGQPSALASWIHAMELKEGSRVFHLGCGVGYYTAIIAELVGPSGTILASEVDGGLAARAARNLSAYESVKVASGDGAALDPGTCDAMLINAGVTHPLPLWLERLSMEGKLVLPITFANAGISGGGAGVMVQITRRPNGYAARVVSFVAIYSCTSVRDPELEPLLGKALGNRSIMKIKSVRLDEHEANASCLVHGKVVCLSSREL